MTGQHIALVDWGTSSLRTWALAPDASVSGPVRDRRGMKFCATGDYRDVLEEQLAALGLPEDAPVLICGMAGARGGWHEVPYLNAPVLLDDLGRYAFRLNEPGRDIRILPGASVSDARHPEVMRGEETQLVGIAAKNLPLVCLPGTHSKWARLSTGRLETFDSFMTGELFELLSHHSVLSKTLDSGWNTKDFAEGVSDALAAPEQVWRWFFGLRAGAVLDSFAWESARSRLSGLLIGAEVAAAARLHGPGPVALVASGDTGAAYGTALRAAGFVPDLIDAETAVVRGLSAAARQIWS